MLTNQALLAARRNVLNNKAVLFPPDVLVELIKELSEELIERRNLLSWEVKDDG